MRCAVFRASARSLAVVAAMTVVVAASCRPSSEIRPAFTKESEARSGVLQGTVFFTGRQDSTSRVFRMDLSDLGRAELASPSGVEERSPALSPDGRKLATAVIGRKGRNGIYVRSASGGGLTAVVADVGVFDYPSWSPDGRSLVYARADGPDDDWDLYVVGADGESERRITRDRTNEWSPAWSPRGDKIAYTSDADGDPAIWLYDVGSESSRKIVDGRGADTQPTWSPDGQTVLYSSDREEERWQLFVYDLEAGRERRLLRTNGMDRYPAWSPDGRYILVSDGSLSVYRTDGERFPGGADRWKVGSRLALSSEWSAR